MYHRRVCFPEMLSERSKETYVIAKAQKRGRTQSRKKETGKKKKRLRRRGSNSGPSASKCETLPVCDQRM